jgi:hypothetical protein
MRPGIYVPDLILTVKENMRIPLYFTRKKNILLGFKELFF